MKYHIMIINEHLRSSTSKLGVRLSLSLWPLAPLVVSALILITLSSQQALQTSNDRCFPSGPGGSPMVRHCLSPSYGAISVKWLMNEYCKWQSYVESLHNLRFFKLKRGDLWRLEREKFGLCIFFYLLLYKDYSLSNFKFNVY